MSGSTKEQKVPIMIDFNQKNQMWADNSILISSDVKQRSNFHAKIDPISIINLTFICMEIV